MIEVGILYSDLRKVRSDVEDAALFNDDALVPKIGVLAVALSTLKDGVPTRLEFVEQADNYMLIVKDLHAALYGWDDDKSGWHRIANPFAVDGYSKPAIPPFLMPYKPDFDYWIFRGEQVASDVWQQSESLRNSLR